MVGRSVSPPWVVISMEYCMNSMNTYILMKTAYWIAFKLSLVLFITFLAQYVNGKFCDLY